MKKQWFVTLVILMLSMNSYFPQNKNNQIDFYNTTYYNLGFGNEIYDKITLKNGEWQGYYPDITSKDFGKKYLEDTGEKYIPGKSEVPGYYVRIISLEKIIKGDLNSDKSNIVVTFFELWPKYANDPLGAIFIFDLQNKKLEPIGKIPLGSRGLGGIADDCGECKGIEINKDNLTVYVYDGESAVDFSTYRIITYKIIDKKLTRIKTSKKYKASHKSTLNTNYQENKTESKNPQNDSKAEFIDNPDILPELENPNEFYGRIMQLYPEIAKRAGIEGEVIALTFIDEKGNVTTAQIQKGIGAGCDQVVLNVLKDTKFIPGQKNGVPVKVKMSIPVKFKLF